MNFMKKGCMGASFLAASSANAISPEDLARQLQKSARQVQQGTLDDSFVPDPTRRPGSLPPDVRIVRTPLTMEARREWNGHLERAMTTIRTEGQPTRQKNMIRNEGGRAHFEALRYESPVYDQRMLIYKAPETPLYLESPAHFGRLHVEPKNLVIESEEGDVIVFRVELDDPYQRTVRGTCRPSREFTLDRMEIVDPGGARSVYDMSDYRRVSGVWFPFRIVHEHFERDGWRDFGYERTVKSVDLTARFPESHFAFEVPERTLATDLRAKSDRGLPIRVAASSDLVDGEVGAIRVRDGRVRPIGVTRRPKRLPWGWVEYSLMIALLAGGGGGAYIVVRLRARSARTGGVA